MLCSYVTGRLVSSSLFFFFVCELTFVIGNRIERCLSHDEKPLPLFQKLENARKDPVFTLKRIKDIRSPISDAGTSSH